jgi:hypothetical protein
VTPRLSWGRAIPIIVTLSLAAWAALILSGWAIWTMV